MNQARDKVFLAIPLMDESERLPFLLADILKQTCRDFIVVICVNQPDNWWSLPEEWAVCERNQETLQQLSSLNWPDLVIIDRSSNGKGWTGKNYGVGWARKVVMDACASMAGDNDIIISLDGDTRFSHHYVGSVVETLKRHPKAVALAVPYFHRLTGDETTDRSILRYEIYMRHYVINLWRIQSPYTFTALGSAMALPVKSYRAIRGMTPNKSGEDFYFLQKLRKYGPVLYWNEEKVFPAARFSDRVFFGTGPAMIKGSSGDWSSYPIYNCRHFDEVGETLRSFSHQYKKTVPTPMDGFLKQIFNEEDPWAPLRKNHPSEQRFVRACHEKVDALRVLQYLKEKAEVDETSDELNMADFLISFYPGEKVIKEWCRGDLKFSTADVPSLNRLRCFLIDQESKYQRVHYQNFNKR